MPDPCEQAWSLIAAAGWGPEHAASSTLHDLRCTEDIANARWYWARPEELAEKGHARYVLEQLTSMLTVEELERLRCT